MDRQEEIGPFNTARFSLPSGRMTCPSQNLISVVRNPRKLYLPQFFQQFKPEFLILQKKKKKTKEVQNTGIPLPSEEAQKFLLSSHYYYPAGRIASQQPHATT